MIETRPERNGLGRSLGALLADEDDAPPRSPLFAVSDVPPATELHDAALALLAAALPDDLCGYSVCHGDRWVSLLSGSAETEAAWSLSDVLRAAAQRQVPVSAIDGDGTALAVPSGPGAAVGVRREGHLVGQRAVLLVQSVAASCVLAAPRVDGTNWR